MSPPLYADLGKSARDIFNRGYNFDSIKLDLKTKTKAGVEFSTGGVSHIDSGKIIGVLETKYKFKEYGVTFSEKWNTNNVLATEVVWQDFFQGAKLGAESTFSPQTGDKSFRFKSEFKNEVSAVTFDSNFKTATPIINATAVLGYKGWLCGYQTQFDTKDSKIKGNNLGLGYSTSDFILHTNVTDGKHFGGLIYQKVNPKLETGIELAWSSENNDTKFGLGSKYVLDNDTFVKAKVNNKSQVGLSYSQKLKDGVTITLSTLIDGKNFNQGGHKIGLGIELEA